MCVNVYKVKSSCGRVSNAASMGQQPTARWAECFLCLVPAEGHNISSDLFNVDK